MSGTISLEESRSQRPFHFQQSCLFISSLLVSFIYLLGWKISTGFSLVDFHIIWQDGVDEGHQEEGGRGEGGGSQLAFLQRSLRMRGCTWQTRKGEQMNRRHQQGMEPRCWLGWVRFKVEEGGNKEGKTRGRNHEWRVLPLVNLSRQAAQALIWLPTWFRWNLTAEYFTRMFSA